MTLNNACPPPVDSLGERIVLAHGEGGRLSRRLIRDMIFRRFAPGNDSMAPFRDGALITTPSRSLVVSTDSFVVTPRFFPGGDIGQLAVMGTVNDLAVSGAVPRWLTLSMIVEEGFYLAELERVLNSIQATAKHCDVQIIAGDTKVVPRGAVDGLFLNTAGIGELLSPNPPGPAALTIGDVLMVSGPIGQHGVAILAARNAFGFTPLPVSDCASLWPAIQALHEQHIAPRAMRDATRGGVAAVLHEWAEACGHTLQVCEALLPISPEVRGVCELLGLDALHLANEGTMLLAVRETDVASTLATLHSTAIGGQASVIGRVIARDIVPVVVKRVLGNLQPLDDPLGAPQPRIC